MSKWHPLSDVARRALAVVMASPRPATLAEIMRGAGVSLITVTRLQANGLIEQAIGGGYVATPDGLKSFFGHCETEKRKAQWPNGGAIRTEAAASAPPSAPCETEAEKCPHWQRCQLRRIG